MTTLQSPTTEIRTRFAPSPTGYLHLGGARTALFAWAFARHHQGSFILRIEDTDLERSTPEAVQAILDGMTWLGLHANEGPIYQTHRFHRHRQVIQDMLQAGTAYLCYSSPEELESMRTRARALGLKPRYDGTWRPEPGKTLPPIPAGRRPVVRFRNPQEGATTWNDMIKGPIRVDNAQLDDLIIARPDGTPTYNFCVVVDDWDMRISHVIRGDDHVNNTPRQINILRALGATPPTYGHVPMILGPDGEKLSKRHGAVSVMEYAREGYLPDAMINYLARLGWSHGNEEIFSRDQLIAWFDGQHLNTSAAQWDPKKLNWLNAHYIKHSPPQELAKHIDARIRRLGGNPNAVDLPAVVELFKDRVETLAQLSDAAMLFCGAYTPADSGTLAQYLDQTARVLLADFYQHAQDLAQWTKADLAALIKDVLQRHQAKMPKLAIALRVTVIGRTQSPSIDAVLALLGRDTVLSRLHETL